MDNPDYEYQDLIRRLQYEQGRQQADAPFPPQQIFELTKEHTAVHAMVGKWRMGELTWEQALAGMVVHLCAVNSQLFQQLVEFKTHNPSPVIVSPEMLEQLKKQSG